MVGTKALSSVITLAVILTAALFLCQEVHAADTFPSKPLTWVLTVGPGMGDTLYRALAKVAEKKFGQPIVIENKPGGASIIGTAYILRQKPDGYTVGLAATSAFTIAPHMEKVPFNPLTDATHVCSIYKYNHGLAVRSDAPWKTYEEVIAYARKNPGKFTYAIQGVGTTQHLIMEMIAMKEGIKWTMVPFTSGGDSTVACLGGHADAVVQGSVDILPHIKAGKLRMLLSLNDFRWKAVPEVPTMVEKGYPFFALNYNGLCGPKGIPEPIRQKMEDVVKEASQDPAFVEVANKYDVEIKFMGGKETTEVVNRLYYEREKVVEAIGLLKK